MATLKEIRENLKTIYLIEGIANIYQEIANFRMRKIREKVLKNRNFIEGLSKVYGQIKRSYLALLKKKIVKKTFVKKTKKRAIVFLSANEIFYGKLILEILKEVLNYLRKEKADLVVVGKIGKYLIKKEEPKLKFFYFDLEDERPEPKQIKKIFDFISNYQKVIIFHGKFETILTQKVKATEITGEIEIEKGIERVKEYLFEPSPEKVVEFFEKEMIFAFFRHAIFEHQLARYATRMMAMHQAVENAKKEIKKLKFKEKKLKSQILDREQIELFSGLKTWKK